MTDALFRLGEETCCVFCQVMESRELPQNVRRHRLRRLWRAAGWPARSRTRRSSRCSRCRAPVMGRASPQPAPVLALQGPPRACRPVRRQRGDPLGGRSRRGRCRGRLRQRRCTKCLHKGSGAAAKCQTPPRRPRWGEPLGAAWSASSARMLPGRRLLQPGLHQRLALGG